MAITSYGYDGQINEAAWALMAPRLGVPYWVEGTPHLRAEIDPNADRTLLIHPGNFGGVGVYDSSDAVETIQFDSVSSGRRYDLVVARRNWQGAGGQTTIAVIKGGTAEILPAYNRNPGAIDDQPLYLVSVVAGRSQPERVIDLRGMGANGKVLIYNKLALDYYDKFPGLEVQVGREIYTLRQNSTWMRTGLEPFTSPAYRARFAQRKTFEEGGPLARVGRGWAVTGDNSMGLKARNDGGIEVSMTGLYQITTGFDADAAYDNIAGSVRLEQNSLWGQPNITPHKNNYPRGLEHQVTWTGILEQGHVYYMHFAHYNQRNRRMTFLLETMWEMIG